MTLPLTHQMLAAARAAGAEIMRFYRDETLAIDNKSDGSPVTAADQQAETIILRYLADTGIPVLGEESVAAGNIPLLGERFFVVDPLDGTKEFIKRNGEFSVNIALVENGVPVAGVITAPELEQEYFADIDGAFSIDPQGVFHPLRTAPDGPQRIVASRSHGHAALGTLCDKLCIEKDISVGSSLKLCLVAKGDAKFYPRFTPTCEWDIAAGQAILTHAGGAVVTLDGQVLGYGKVEKKFYNPFFVAAASNELAQDAAEMMRELIIK